MHRIIIKCKTDGEVEVKAENILGESCSTKTKPFIDILGQKVREIPTAEMFQGTNHEKVEVDTRE